MFKFIDLFCGIGGFRIALEHLNAECVFSSDIDKYARQTYYDNFNEYPAGDITQINENDIPNHDILCAGFPCQPFSIAGKRLGFNDTRGTLFFDILRIIKAKKPRAFILENVAGIINHDNKKTINTILELLKQENYNIFYEIINATDLGIPQNRKRWYCVGIDKNYKANFIFPKKLPKQINLENIIEKKEIKEYEITKIAKENINKFKDNIINNHDLILAYEIRKSRCSFKTDKISPCLTAKMGTGGNNVPVLVNFNRKLTEMECLGLMGFPKEYKIKKNYSQSYKQIGNSVIVPIIEEIAKELFQILRMKNEEN